MPGKASSKSRRKSKKTKKGTAAVTPVGDSPQKATSNETSQTVNSIGTGTIGDVSQSQNDLAGVGAWCDDQGAAIDEPWLLDEAWANEPFGQ
ncbi:hypothetical protein PG989_005391 [Apiospora arundinis]|uniref:Uncharacterized protein n=1 Tax=Apiospora arundinis TaxID=335852 RepID=A0ABR2ITX9_9PEZI